MTFLCQKHVRDTKVHPHFPILLLRLKSASGSVCVRVWTGGQWVQWETRPLHVQGNPLHLRKFPLHFQTCLKVGFKTSPAILLSKIFYGNFSKKSSSFLAKF